YATDIIASEMQMLGSREGMGGPGGNDGGDEGGERQYSRPPAAAPRAPAAAARPPAPTKAASGFDDMDDDIPF
ncbi:MAG: single-stranded DNA-binding protein, partial [Polaromonas sp.]|nr:single-stranded DNA-binding protein [Polaromonas sp.]